MAQLSAGCEKGWNYLSPQAGSGKEKSDIVAAGAAAGGAAVFSTFYVLMSGYFKICYFFRYISDYFIKY